MHKPRDFHIAQLRNRALSRTEFRASADALSQSMAQEVAAYVSAQSNILLVPIMRSGLALLPAFLTHFSDARVGIVGFKRKESDASAHLYYQNIPSLSEIDRIIILDPMIATGNTAAATIALLVDYGAQQEQIVLAALLSAVPGMQALAARYPHVKCIVAAEDPLLDQHYFISPGLGDFGDRFFGTE